MEWLCLDKLNIKSRFTGSGSMPLAIEAAATVNPNDLRKAYHRAGRFMIEFKIHQLSERSNPLNFRSPKISPEQQMEFELMRIFAGKLAQNIMSNPNRPLKNWLQAENDLAYFTTIQTLIKGKYSSASAILEQQEKAKDLVATAFEKVCEILTQNQESLHILAEKFAQGRTLNGEEIYDLVPA